MHGNSNVLGATLFPHNIGLGAAHNKALVGKMAQAVGQAVRATGINWVFAPTLAVVRDDRWGRTYESFSEDPALVREYGGAYVRGLQGNNGLTDTQAVAAFETQSQARRDAAPGSLLAARLGLQPAEQRNAFVTQVAVQDTPRTALALQAWMQQKTGRTLALAEAVAAFESLPLERQVSWLNQVLVDEVRTQGRAAAAASGFEAEAAYLRGYQAINTVFAVDRPGGEIRLPTTQVKTLQQANNVLVPATDKERAVRLGAVTMMVPGGGVNAGELGSTSQSANNLGI
eukprot:gene52803-70589_t